MQFWTHDVFETCVCVGYFRMNHKICIGYTHIYIYIKKWNIYIFLCLSSWKAYTFWDWCFVKSVWILMLCSVLVVWILDFSHKKFFYICIFVIIYLLLSLLEVLSVSPQYMFLYLFAAPSWSKLGLVFLNLHLFCRLHKVGILAWLARTANIYKYK